jgi:hypothetical protein
MRDLAMIALGFVLFTVGVTAVLLATAYWRLAGWRLLSFGLLTLLYGTRILIGVPALAPLFDFPGRSMVFTTAFIVYALPVVGLVYAEQIRGPGWRSSLRRLWQVGLVMMGAFIAYDSAIGRPWASLPVYRVFVNAVMVVLLPHVVLWRHRDRVETIERTAGTATLLLPVIHDNLMGFRLLPWRVSLEMANHPGVKESSRSVGSLPTSAAGHCREEMATARSIQSRPAGSCARVRNRIAVRFVPARWVGGDVYDFLSIDEGRLVVLVADVTGHGVPAALIASMVKVAFSSQIQHADEPGRILSEVNRVLSGRFEGRFVTAACIYLDADCPLARYSLAGHPPPLLRQHATGELVELREGGLPLGLFPEVVYPTAAVAFGPGDRLLLYTDGLTDARDRSGAWFGDSELGPFMAASRATSAGGFLDALMSHLHRWSGREPGLTEDDLTAVVIDRR